MSSGEDLAANLRNYLIQLQQVEAALTSDANNEELLKLKDDLEEVIKLTKNLMSEEGGNDDGKTDSAIVGQGDEIRHNFLAGDIVLAPWSEDGQFYEAEIEDIMSDGQCNVNFHSLPSGKGRISEVCLITLLKPLPGAKKKLKLEASQTGFASMGDSSGNRINTKQKRLQLQQQRDYLWKKKQKKQSRLKVIEQEREQVKHKWQQFNEKAVNKRLKGATTLAKKESIFKSPDTVEGKVGVGTCGIAGKPMTNFVVADKYKRGSSSSSSSSSASSSRHSSVHSYSNMSSSKYK